MGFLTSMLGGEIISALANTFIGKATEAFTAYLNKQISIEELRSRVQIALSASFAEIEKSHADALAKTFESFTGAMIASRLVRWVWATVVLSQLGVLTAHQTGFIAASASIEWAYLLIGGLCGLGPIILRHGPGMLPVRSIADAVKK